MYYGIHNFDNFLNSLQVTFQLVTLENWSSYMYTLMDVDVPWFAVLYVLTVVVIGSFFLMNLILAVIINAFITITRKELEEEAMKLQLDEDGPDVIGPQEIIDELSEEDELDPSCAASFSIKAPTDNVTHYMNESIKIRKSSTQQDPKDFVASIIGKNANSLQQRSFRQMPMPIIIESPKPSPPDKQSSGTRKRLAINMS